MIVSRLARALVGGTMPPTGVTRTVMTDEEMFRSLLDKDQLKALDSPWEWQPWLGDKRSVAADICVRGSTGTWTLRLTKFCGVTHCYLFDPSGRQRCFHAVRERDIYLDTEAPYKCAVAFLCAVECDDQWVRTHSG